MNFNFHYLTLIFGYAFAIGNEKVEWNIDEKMVQIGDTLKLTCTVDNFDFMDVIRLNFFPSHNQTNYLEMAQANVLKHPFSILPRYHVKFDARKNSGFIEITYSEIQARDDGKLECFKLGSDNKAYVRIKVAAPVKELKLFAISYDDEEVIVKKKDDDLVLNEKLHKGFGCLASTYEKIENSNFRLHVGENFQKNVEYKLKLQQEESNKIDIVSYVYENKVIQRTDWSKIDLIEQIVTCTAAMPGGILNSTTVNMIFKYFPRAECTKIELHSNEYIITCFVRANSMFNTSVFDTADEEMKKTITEKIAAKNHFELNIKLSDVIEGVYEIIFSNDVGHSSVKLNIAEEYLLQQRVKQQAISRENNQGHIRRKDSTVKSAAVFSDINSEASSKRISIYIDLLCIICLLCTNLQF